MQQLNTLILNADDLLSTLVSRRQAIVRLLSSTSTVAKQLSGLVHDNEAKLAPSLAKLNSVTAMLESNRDNLSKAIPGLAQYEITQGETVSSGFYYNPLIPNLFQYQFFQWLVDYSFGFRAYGAPGSPTGQRRTAGIVPVPVQPEPWRGDDRFGAIPRKKLKAGPEILLAALVVFGVAVGIRKHILPPHDDTAFFPSATAIYPGDDVRASGQKDAPSRRSSPRAPRRTRGCTWTATRRFQWTPRR